MNRLAAPLVAGLILAATVVAPAALPDTVKLETGLVSGVAGTSADVRLFKGIPFAAPPVGNLRWKAPQAAARWDGVRKGDQFGPRCMQGGGGQGAQPMSEDCLYLNVWTTAAAASDKRPVMVWSYGGAFTGGAGSTPGYDGEALARKGVVVVTYNYRLGPFGWFSHPELTRESGRNASGNYGLMDLMATLQWVQKNIAGFGGDPQRVTIFGESAGGALVAAAVGSQEGKGLFHRAISESASWMGTRMATMMTLAEAEAAGVKVAETLGATSLADLRAVPAEQLQKDGRGARPMVDGWYVKEDLSATFAQGRQQEVDVLVGSNKDEGTFAFFGLGRGNAQQYLSQSRGRFGDLADTYLALYPAGASDDEAHAAERTAFRDELSWQMRTWAALQAKRSGRSKAYVFYFTHEPPVAAGQPNRGASHTAEIPYVFNIPGRLWTAADFALADMMSSYWVNFAATGDPNGTGLPVWPQYRDKATGRAMILGDRVEAEAAPDRARLALYDSLFAKQLSAKKTD